MNLRAGGKYKSIETGKVFTLKRDYNGVSWYLHCRDEDGLTKSFTYSENAMVDILTTHYEKYKKTK
ncbi:hypothetical protein [Priestia aryabhattai]